MHHHHHHRGSPRKTLKYSLLPD